VRFSTVSCMGRFDTTYFRQDNETFLGQSCDLSRHALRSKVTYIHTCIGGCGLGVVRVGCGIIKGRQLRGLDADWDH
jgi:hypothetical protein